MEKKSLSRNGDYLVRSIVTDASILKTPTQYPFYTILFVQEGAGTFRADFGLFPIKSPVILFSTPLQTLQLEGEFDRVIMLQFHGDFYCIEYHKKEVACNGLLFNNIYIDPYISLPKTEVKAFNQILNDLHAELSDQQPSESVVTAYLQLFLAKATSIKTKSLYATQAVSRDEKMESFRNLIDEHYLTLRKPSEYADLLHLSPDTLTKRCKQYFKKSPTELIHERIILEAKKGLHLTRKSIKEIAYDLKFNDEHYFSRFFKKMTKVTPSTFRLKAGISIVADLST